MCSNYTAMSFDNPEMSSVYSPMSVEWKEIMTKAALTGTIAGVAAAFLTNAGDVTLAGISIPGTVAAGLGVAAGSVTGDLAHKYILPHIPQNQKFAGAESALISVGGSVAGAYVALNMMGGSTPLTAAAVLGGGSYVASDYVYHHVLDRNTGGFML